MSAFIVSHTHINALVTFAAKRHHYSFPPRLYLKDHTPLCMDDAADLQRTAEILLKENVRSVNERYPDTLNRPDLAPGPVDEVGQPITFRPVRNHTAVQILKACACYDYQACETDDYYTTEAAHLIGQIRKKAIGELPGYEEAKWELT